MCVPTIGDFEAAKFRHPDKPCDKPTVWEHYKIVGPLSRDNAAPVRVTPPFEVPLPCICGPLGRTFNPPSPFSINDFKKCESPRCVRKVINVSVPSLPNPT